MRRGYVHSLASVRSLCEESTRIRHEDVTLSKPMLRDLFLFIIIIFFFEAVRLCNIGGESRSGLDRT